MPDWIGDHQTVLGWAFVASIVMFVGGIVTVPWLVVQMPHDFFLRHERPPKPRHPALHVALLIARNAIGWPLLAAGFAMLVLPGQGLLTILVAVALIDFPGKRRVELALVRQRPIHGVIDWLRHRRGKPPILLPEAPPDAGRAR